MNLTFLIIAAVLLCCFFAAYLWFAVINRRLNDISFGSPFFGNVFFPVWLVAFAGCTALYFLLPEQNDQLFDISFLNVAAAFISAAAVCLLSLHARIARWNYALFLAAAILNTLLLPQGFMLFEGTLPFWLDRLTIALIWSLFAWAYKYLDGLEGIVAVQTVTPLCGMVILAFLGAIPILTGCFSAVFALIMTAYAVYNWYPAQLRLTTSGCQALGFLTAWLFMLAAREGSASCALIFSLYYIVEVIWAGLKKLSRKPQYQEIVPNTFYYQTNLSGLSPDIISENIFKLDALLVIFGCFQIYAPNSYSLAILGIILTFWFLNHLRNWQVAERSLGEINREVVKDLKENVEGIKKNLDKDI